jgi:hypothetical protein
MWATCWGRGQEPTGVTLPIGALLADQAAADYTGGDTGAGSVGKGAKSPGVRMGRGCASPRPPTTRLDNTGRSCVAASGVVWRRRLWGLQLDGVRSSRLCPICCPDLAVDLRRCGPGPGPRHPFLNCARPAVQHLRGRDRADPLSPSRLLGDDADGAEPAVPTMSRWLDYVVFRRRHHFCRSSTVMGRPKCQPWQIVPGSLASASAVRWSSTPSATTSMCSAWAS